MKYILIILFLFLSAISFGQSYYISPNGNDNTGDGSMAYPWFNVGFAVNQCSPGDTVYAKTGTYNYNTQQSITVSGTAGNYIVVIAVGDHPDSVVFDFNTYPQSVTPNQSIYGIYAYGRSYLKFERFSLRRLLAIDTDNGRAHGLYFQESNHIDFNWLQIDSIAGRGVMGYHCGSANFTNCDFSWCADPQDADPGNAGVGIIWYNGEDSFTDTVRITGCRFWQNADQGLETLHRNIVYVNSIWSWDNDLHDEGYTFGTGNGIKPALGYNSDTPITVTNSIIAFNRIGVNENTSSGGYKFNFNFLNNIVYANSGVGIIATRYPSSTTPELGSNRQNIYRNNISFDNGGYDMQILESADHGYNSFDSPYTTPSPSASYMNSPATVSDADFIDMPADKAECTTVLGAARGASGSLPDIGDYFHLTTGSDLIGQGIGVGLIYDGDGNLWSQTAPSLGAFEYDAPEPPEPPDYPAVTTVIPTTYNSFRATTGGINLNDGMGTISAKGVCWSTSANPTTSDSKTVDGTGTDDYASEITGLSSGTTYHIRAYVTNETGTTYGADVALTTPSVNYFQSGGKFLYDPATNKFIKR